MTCTARRIDGGQRLGGGGWAKSPASLVRVWRSLTRFALQDIRACWRVAGGCGSCRTGAGAGWRPDAGASLPNLAASRRVRLSHRLCSSVEQHLDGFFIAEGRGAMQRGFAAGANVAHEAAGFRSVFCGMVGSAPWASSTRMTRLCAIRSVVQRRRAAASRRCRGRCSWRRRPAPAGIARAASGRGKRLR